MQHCSLGTKTEVKTFLSSPPVEAAHLAVHGIT